MGMSVTKTILSTFQSFVQYASPPYHRQNRIKSATKLRTICVLIPSDIYAKIQELSNMYMVSLNELALGILSFKMTRALEKDPTLFLKDIPDNALLEESS